MNHDHNIPESQSLVDQYKKLLLGLSGILSARVSLDTHGNIREIHVLATADRNVKQVVRDVRSALSSFFDLDVDHRIISVAQMKDDLNDFSEAFDPQPRTLPSYQEPRGTQVYAEPAPVAPPPLFTAPQAPVQPAEPASPALAPVVPDAMPFLPQSAAPQTAPTIVDGPPRLRTGRISQSIEDDNYAVTVSLKYGGQAFDGGCSSRNNEPQRMACIVNAVLSALHNFIGQDNLFRLVGVKRVTTMPIPVCMVIIEYNDGWNSTMLVGATEMIGDEAVSVERATLDAINRKLGHHLSTS